MDRQPSKQLHSRGVDWAWLLAPANGGPGESPGRAAAAERAKQRSADKARLKTSKKPQKNLAISNQQVQKKKISNRRSPHDGSGNTQRWEIFNNQ